MTAVTSLKVIDFTPTSESNVAKRLAEDIDVWSRMGRANISSSYVKIGNIADLKAAFQKIIAGCDTHRDIPILHIEAHGSKKIISVGQSHSLTWGDFLEILRAVNIATRNNLAVTMAVCKSAWLQLSVAHDQPCPFCLLIAPIEDVKVGEIEDGFRNFYRTLLANHDIDGCLQALNASIISSGNAFVPLDAEDMFYDGARSYVERYSSNVKLQPRLEKLVSRGVTGGITKEIPLPEFRRILRRELRTDPGTYLKPLFDTFMMIDQFPENKNRFEFNIERVR